MAESPGFGAMLAWLLDRRGLGVEELAARTGVNVDQVRAVLMGETPGGEMLRRFAAELGLRAVDLFLLAGLAVPDDLAPLDAAAGQWARRIVMDGVHLPAAGRRELLQVISSLPQEERSSAFTVKGLGPLPHEPGGQLIRMLRYRNLDWPGIAQILAVVTPTYLSAATFGVIGAGRKELTPRLVIDFAALLGIDARELAMFTGTVLPEVPGPAAPEAVDAAALLWNARRLSADQARHVAELARTMRPYPGNGYVINLPGS